MLLISWPDLNNGFSPFDQWQYAKCMLGQRNLTPISVCSFVSGDETVTSTDVSLALTVQFIHLNFSVLYCGIDLTIFCIMKTDGSFISLSLIRLSSP
jgi:hypothetical protein